MVLVFRNPSLVSSVQEQYHQVAFQQASLQEKVNAIKPHHDRYVQQLQFHTISSFPGQLQKLIYAPKK